MTATTEMTYKFSKDTSEVYRIRLDSHRCQWANITINSSGEFSAITDCGNFNYRWPVSKNENFKQSLIRICSKATANGYLYEKIYDRDRASRIDAEKTIVKLKRELFQYYRDRRNDYFYMAKQKGQYPDLATRMRDAYDELESIGNEGEVSQDAFYGMMWNSRYLSEIFDGDYIVHAMDVETIGDRRAAAFCEVVAPIFAEILKQEVGV